MRRIPRDNPDCEGLLIQTLDLQAWPLVQADFDRTIPDAIPPGFEPYIKRVNSFFEFGLRKVGATDDSPKKTPEQSSVPANDFDKMSEAGLKTWAGQHGVAYDDKPARGVLLARIKAKAAEVKK